MSGILIEIVAIAASPPGREATPRAVLKNILGGYWFLMFFIH